MIERIRAELADVVLMMESLLPTSAATALQVISKRITPVSP